MVVVPLSTYIQVYILCTQISHIYAAKCLDVEEHNQCHQFDDVCYRERKRFLNCKNGTYHCGRNSTTKTFTETCASPKECGIGEEPWIFSGPNGDSIECRFCHDSGYYNPNTRTMSNEFSHCEEAKDECSNTANMFKCEVREDDDLYTKNVRCRCDVRRGYIIDRRYKENEPACSYERGLSCLKARCYPAKDVLIIGYKCAPKCPNGYSRSSEYSDECFPENTPAPPVTPKPESPLSPPALPNMSTPSMKTRQTTTLAPKTYTTTSTKTTTAVTESQSGDNSKTLMAVAVSISGTFVLTLIGLGVGYCIRKKKKKTKKKGIDPEGQKGGNEKETSNGTSAAIVTNKTENYYAPVTIVKGKSSANIQYGKVEYHPNDSQSDDESAILIKPVDGSQHTSMHSHSLKHQGHKKQQRNMKEGKYSKTDNQSDYEDTNLTDNEAAKLMRKPGKPLVVSQHSSKDSLKPQGSKQMQHSRSEIDGANAQSTNTNEQKSCEQQQDRSQSLTLSVKSGTEVRIKLRRLTSKSMYDLPYQEKVVILHHRNVQQKIKNELHKMALDGCYTALVEHLDPQPLCDRFREKQMFTDTVIRDMRQSENDSQRNRSIIDKVSRSGWKNYVIFKECLKESCQEHIVELLQEKEIVYLKGIAQAVLRDVDIKDLTELHKCFDKSILSQKQQELISIDLKPPTNSDDLAGHKNDMVENCDWGVYTKYKDHLKDTEQQTAIEKMESLELKYKDEMQPETAGQEVLSPRSDDTAGVFDPDGNPAQESDDSGTDRSMEALLRVGDTDHDPDDEIQPKELLQEIAVSTVSKQEEHAENQLKNLANCKYFEDFVELSETMTEPDLTLPNRVDFKKLRKKEYSGCPDGFQPFHTTGRQNSCLYQSFSCLLFGDENRYKTLRLKAALYAARHWEKIIEEYQTTLKDTPQDEVLSYLLSMASNPTLQLEKSEMSKKDLINSFMKKVIKETAILGTDSCQIHVFFISRALGRSIISYSQRPDDNLTDQVVEGDDKPLHIMWVNSSNDPKGAPNHVVPLIRTTVR